MFLTEEKLDKITDEIAVKFLVTQEAAIRDLQDKRDSVIGAEVKQAYQDAIDTVIRNAPGRIDCKCGNCEEEIEEYRKYVAQRPEEDHEPADASDIPDDVPEDIKNLVQQLQQKAGVNVEFQVMRVDDLDTHNETKH